MTHRFTPAEPAAVERLRALVVRMTAPPFAAIQRDTILIEPRPGSILRPVTLGDLADVVECLDALRAAVAP